MTGASEWPAREFADAFRSFLEWVHSDQAGAWQGNEVAALVGDFLGERASERSVLTRSLPVFEHVNLQTALDAWSHEPGREVVVQGISIGPHHGKVTLQQLVTGEAMPPLRLSAPSLIDLPNGPGSTLACLQLAVLLVTDAEGRYVVMVSGPAEHDQTLELEIAGLSVSAAQAAHARLAELRSRLNVYRGHVLEVSIAPMGGVSLEFGDIPLTARDDVVLPETVLGRVERHALGVAGTARRCSRPVSTSSAVYCCTGHRAPARRIPLATWSARWADTPASCSPGGRCTRSTRRPSSLGTCSRLSSCSRMSI